MESLMSSQENIPESDPFSKYGSTLSQHKSTPLHLIDPSFSRAKLLEEDRLKRRKIYCKIYFISGVLLFSTLVVIIALLFKPDLIQDRILIDNIELLSNNDGIDFYNNMEFYQWLDTKPEGTPRK